MNARRHDFLRPLVESLEPRRLLACEVFVRDQTLLIIGDEADNRIEIVADDRGVQVTCDGGETQTFSASDAMRLFVDAGDAHDTLDIQVQPGGQLTQFEIHAGAGVDNVHVRLPAENAGVAIHAAIGAAGLADIELDHPPQEDPVTAARFELSIDGQEFAAFQELQDLETEVERVDFISSEDKETILVKLSDDENILGIKLSGQWSTASNLTIEAGMRRDQVQIVDQAGHSADMTVDVNLGDGDDEVAVDINGDLLPDIAVHTGAGDDTVHTHYVGSANGGVWKFDTGTGNDRLAHELVHTFQQGGGAAKGPTEQTRQITIIQDMGDGDDEVVTHFTKTQELVPGKVTLWDHEFEFGDGNDRLQFITSVRADGFQIKPGEEDHSVEIGVTDLASGSPTANLRVVDTEDIAIKAGDGDDEFNVNGRIGAALHLFGQGGDDVGGFKLGETDFGVLPGLPANFDGGSGRDVLTITGTDLAAVFDLIGISRLEIPDPEIQVTDLATGIVTAEFSIVGTEAITVDSRGGDDQIVMREVDAPLSDVDWTIHTGGGNDTVDARLGAIPDVLHVLTGPGNDDVDVVFADNGISRPPRDADGPVPDILVDVGAGVDSVMLDVFGSLTAPPSDLGPQVTLEEVLASIFIMGVGQLAILTLFPLGALNMAQAIKDDRAGHTKTEVALVLDGADVDLSVGTGKTLDAVLLGIHPLPNSRIDLDLNTGGGDDQIEVRSTSPTGPLDWSLNVAPGGGEDEVLVAFEHGDISRPVVIGALWNDKGKPKDQRGSLGIAARARADEFQLDFDLVGSAGRDAVDLNLFYPSASGPIVSDIDLATGQGNDQVDLNIESAAASLAQNVRIDAGAGHDRVNVSVPDAHRDGLADLIVGADAGAGPHVKAFDGGTHAEVKSFLAYDASFAGGVRAAAGDVNGDGVADIITGAGPGAGPHVKVFDGASHAELASFFAYDANFTGGLFVAAGDVNNDGFADIITGAGATAAGGHVKVFDGRTGALVRSFFAFDPSFLGGVQVAAGDVNGDTFDDIVVGAGPGGSPHVKVFDGRSGELLHSFFAYDAAFAGGVYVAAGDINGDGRDDLVTGAGAGAPGGHVKVFSGATGAEIRSFLAYDPSFSGDVRVAAGDLNGDGFSDIVTGAGPGAPGGHVKVFDGQTHAELRSFLAFEPSFAGGVFVAAGDLNSSAVVRRIDLDLAIDTAGGEDAVAVELSAAATEELLQKVRLNTGDGADRASVIWRKLQLQTEFPNEVEADVSIDTGGGNDRADVELQPGSAADNIYSFKLQLGTGNDIARYWVFGTELPPLAPREPIDQAAVNVELQVLGAQGNDDIEGRIGSDPLGRLLPLALDWVRIEIDGGAGRDRLSLEFRGPILEGAAVDAVLRGGAGHDQVRARFDLDPASNGRLSAKVLGEAGNDELGLAVLNADDLDLLFALLDGGSGKDRCRTTPNVKVINCP